MEALKSGKLQLAFGGMGGGPLWGGRGLPTKPMKDNVEGKAKLTNVGKTGDAAKQAKVSKEFQKYAGMAAQAPTHTPNAAIKGVRNMNNTELVQQYTGDPQKGIRTGTPYYEAGQVHGRASESAVDKENIPAAYRKQVKDYFEKLKQ